MAVAEHHSYSGLSPKRKIITMVGVLLAMLLSSLDQTIVGTALPQIVRDLGGLDHISWVVTAYLLASTISVPIYGKLSDMFGRKWFFFSGIVIFLIGSILSGLSQSMLQLIIFRAIQGIGGGAIMGNAFAIIGDLFEPAERGKWQGIMGGVFGLSSVIGPTLGGFLTDSASWRWVFYVNLPLGLIAMAVVAYLMPKIRAAHGDKTIDYLGAALLTSTLVPSLLALMWGGNQYPWASVQILTMAIIGAISLAAFLAVERKAAQPILPLDLFKNRIFTVSVMLTFLTSAALFGAIVYIPLFAQLVMGASATNSGAILTPLMLGLVFASITSGQIISRTGKYKNMAKLGLFVLASGLVLLATMGANVSQLGLMMRMVVTGMGLGLTMPIFTLSVQNAFDSSRLGVVTAGSQLFRGIGSTVGTAVLGSVFNSSLHQRTADLAQTDLSRLVQQHHLPFTAIVDPAKLQQTLSVEGQSHILSSFAKIPGALGSQLTTAFHTYVIAGKGAFAASVSVVFLVGALIAGIAFLLSFALMEIPLRSSKSKSAVAKAGNEFAVELGQANANDEPELVN